MKRMESCRTGAWPLAQTAAMIMFVAARCSAATEYVSATSTNPAPPYSTPATAATNIQDAVNVANNGDTVLVEPGQYNLTNQVTITKAITLRSIAGAGQTTLHAVNYNWCLWVSNSLAVADGFTLSAQGDAYGAGGIFSVGGTIQNCAFNYTVVGPGLGTVTMVGGILSNSVVDYAATPAEFDPVGVYCTGGGLVTDCQILGSGGGNGAGVYLENSRLTGSLVTGVGWSYSSPSSSTVTGVSSTITGCTIAHNTGWTSEVSLDGCVMDRCTVAYNTRFNAGGAPGSGIFETNSIIRDSLIVSNSMTSVPGASPGGLGGGVYMQGGALVNCTVSENGAADGDPSNTNPGQGGGVYAESGGITNCIIYGNHASAGSEWYNVGPASFDHCCTTPDPGGTGNITQDPQFLGSTNGNFHLATNSPCLAAGVVQSWMTGAEDLDGNPRTVNGAVDLGAYESQSGQGHTTPVAVKVLSSQWLNSKAGNVFTFSFQTQTNRTYTVQSTCSLSPANWQTLTNFSGSGTVMNVTNQNPASPSCFYRVLAQ